jgi:hypothetical protein
MWLISSFVLHDTEVLNKSKCDAYLYPMKVLNDKCYSAESHVAQCITPTYTSLVVVNVYKLKPQYFCVFAVS